MTLHVELVSPDQVDFSGEAQMVIARTLDGDIAFMEGHVPFIGALASAPLRIIGADGADQGQAREVVPLGFAAGPGSFSGGLGLIRPTIELNMTAVARLSETAVMFVFVDVFTLRCDFGAFDGLPAMGGR